MKNLPKEKIKTITIILLSITLIITLPMLIREKQEDQEQFQAFLNEFYHHLDNALMTADYMLENTEEIEGWEYNLTLLRHRLEQTGLVSRAGNRFIDWEIRIEPYYFNYRLNFKVEDKPTERQLSELENIRDALLYIKEGLYSEERGQEDQGISIEQFNKVIMEGAKLAE